ncbi:MAG: DUF642 domain-containing protein [Synergistales bacterium]|nr:DUF642 domain-containing protein [Synergistales bacterium]
MSCLSCRTTGSKKQPRFSRTVLFLALLVSATFLLSSAPAEAVADPEIIQWRAYQNADFLNSLFMGVLGRGPSQEEFNFYITRDLSRNMGRGEAFWSLLGTQEYTSRFGSPQGPYQVLWKHREIDTDRGLQWCRCYFFTKDPALSGGTPAVMQYLGVRTPWGNYSFSVARAVTRMYAHYDREVCPHYDCGWGRGDSALFDPADRNSSGGGGGGGRNYARDPHFAQFTSGNAWGTGQYSNFGIWWNSRNADSRATVVNLGGNRPPNSSASTALYLVNNSGRTPHVFGSTSQRITVRKGARYTVSFWASARNLASRGAVNIAVDPQWNIRPISMDAGSYGWTFFSGTFTAPDNYVDLRIIFEDRGEVWITEMTLTDS